MGKWVGLEHEVRTLAVNGTVKASKQDRAVNQPSKLARKQINQKHCLSFHTLAMSEA